MKKIIFNFGLILALGFMTKLTIANATDEPVSNVMGCNLTAEQKNAILTNLNGFLAQNKIPKTVNGKSVNQSVYANDCIIVYGSPHGTLKNGEYRYLGYASDGVTEISNPYFPSDAGGNTIDWTWAQPFILKTQGIGDYNTRIRALGRTVDGYAVTNTVALGKPITPDIFQKYLKIDNPGNGNPRYGYNKHDAYIVWNSSTQEYEGKELNRFADIVVLPTTYTGGVFRTYNWGSDGIASATEKSIAASKGHPGYRWYASYYMASYKSAVPSPKYDLSLISSSFTISPKNPKPNESVTITFDAKLTSTLKNDTKNFNNVPLKFGWKTGNTNYNWCTYVPSIKVGQTVKITLNSSQNKNCAVPSQVRSNFVYPGEGGRQVFYAEINQDENNPSDETSYTNNYFFKSVVGTVVPQQSNLTLKHYPTYPSTKVDGAQGSYYKATYAYQEYGYQTDMVYPTSISFTYSLKDLKGKVLTSGTGSNTITASCFNNVTLVYTCGDYIFYIGKATNSFSSVPDATNRLFYSNVGTNDMNVKLTENGWHVYQTYDLTKCNKDLYCVPTTNKAATKSTRNVIFSTDISGVSTGVGK